jgi:hypothetical protein
MNGRARAAWRLAGAALLLAYGLVLFHHTSFAPGGADSSGYLNSARLFARGRATEPIRGLERLGLAHEYANVFVPLGYTPLENRPGWMAPSYPPGFPLHMALAGRLGGWTAAPFLVSPLAGIACIVLLFFLGRELRLSRGFAAGGSLILAFFPTFVFQELQPMSDVLATAWAIATVLGALRARSRGSPGWAAFAGFAFGMAVLVRPTNLLLIVPVSFALGLRFRTWFAFAAGGVPAAGFLLAYNRALFGNPLTTGYRNLLAEGMAWSNFPVRLRHYGVWLARLLTPIVPLAWLALPFDRRASLRDRATLFSWFAAFLLFYCFYATYETWWYTRFLLPGIPGLILGALVVVRDLVERIRRPAGARAMVAVTVVALVVFVGARFGESNRVHKFYKGERQYERACEMARRALPKDALVVSMQMSGALHYYTDATCVMWNWLLPDAFAALRAEPAVAAHRWYALLAPFEQPEVRKNLPGDWREVDRSGDVALWELRNGDRSIFENQRKQVDFSGK